MGEVPAVVSAPVATPDPDVDNRPPEGPPKKHRHDLGQEDHGSKLAAGTTRAIQILLGMWIAATLLLVVWALVDSGRTRPSSVTPTATLKG